MNLEEESQMFKDKYDLTLSQNTFLAKKLIADSVYCGIQLEGSPLTFPETQTLLDGVNIPHASLNDIQTVLNMRDAWKYVLKTINEPFTLDYVCKVNELVARNESLEWGVLRTGDVGISGTSYRPEIPQKEYVDNRINELMNSNMSATEKALTYFLWGARSQLFWDGNKRTSLICANKLLIMQGKGIIAIPTEKIPQFNTLLTHYYESKEHNNLMEFLYESSIRGIEFQNQNNNVMHVEPDR